MWGGLKLFNMQKLTRFASNKYFMGAKRVSVFYFNPFRNERGTLLGGGAGKALNKNSTKTTDIGFESGITVVAEFKSVSVVQPLGEGVEGSETVS